jgi:hypothetical protein
MTRKKTKVINPNGWCNPTVPNSLRTALYAHYGLDYKGGQWTYPIPFWELLDRLLKECESLQTKPESLIPIEEVDKK